ncbi:hypothetical protein [Actinomyces sp. HMT897]|uniref:hypothetical protein n=1 Tax=Actinomyces sp. HMT897 TaxID=2789424 RepID=UPI00190AA8B3|nr:hypothetical protein [Actinomyces sp. HMT897]QQO78146.1 hypothetical protein JJJ15_01920 [Actinomyces sp. HMT897]
MLTADQIMTLTDLTTRYTRLREKLEETRAELDTITTAIAALAPKGTTQVGDVKITVTTPGTLNIKALTMAYPYDEHPDLYTHRISTKAVRDTLAPNALTSFTRTGSPRVTIK